MAGMNACISMMTNLFDNTEKCVKFIQNVSEELQIKNVLNPFNQVFIEEQRAKELGIISNGYYRNRYGGLIPISIAASKGFIQFSTNDLIEIEYRSKQCPVITKLIIHQVYDDIHQCIMTCRQAMDKGYLNLELFSYSNLNLSMTIHEAFYRGLIIGELRTNRTESKALIDVNEKRDFEYENLFSSLTNIINSLSEFRNTINIIDDCELTSDGFIKQKKTGKCYLLTQAMELGLVSIKDITIKSQMDNSKNASRNFEMESTLVNDTISSNDEDEINPYFSDTFISDLLKATVTTTDDVRKGEIDLTNMKQFLPPINTC